MENQNQKTIVAFYSSYFTSLEARYTTITGHRNFTFLRKSMKIILSNFNQSENGSKSFDNFMNDLLDWSNKYKQALSDRKYLSGDDVASLKKTQSTQNINDRIKDYSSLFKQIDNIDKQDTLLNHIKEQSKLPSTKILHDHPHYENKIKGIFSQFIIGLNKIETILEFLEQKGKEENQPRIFIHSYDQAINEFHQGFSHYSCAEFAYLKLKEITAYSHDNYNRSVGHFRRAILDLYKIILLLITENHYKTSPLTKEQYQQIAQIRHKDGIHISTDFNERLKRYKSIIEELEPTPFED